GGVLLIGIKDNGKPTKINCTEEAYMIEAAISKCKPEIKHEINTHEIDGKQILSVNVYQGVELPYLCLDENKKWMAYVRSNDSNVLANWVWLQVAKNKSKKENIQLEYVGIDEMVLKSIKQNPGITQRDLSKEIKQNFRKVGNSLVKLVGMGIVKMIFSKTGAFYQLNV
ncbi:MAG: RNA-binding domain-containing protein, partial [Bacteroidia bacterium]